MSYQTILNNLVTKPYCCKNLILEDNNKRLYFGLVQIDNDYEDKCKYHLAFIVTNLNDDILSMFDVTSYDHKYPERALLTHMIRFANTPTKIEIELLMKNKNNKLMELGVIDTDEHNPLTYDYYINDILTPDVKVMKNGILILTSESHEFYVTKMFIPFNIENEDKVYEDLYKACVDMFRIYTKVDITKLFNDNDLPSEYLVLHDNDYNLDVFVRRRPYSILAIELVDSENNRTLSSVELKPFNNYSEVQMLFYYMSDCAGGDTLEFMDKYHNMDIFRKWSLNRVYEDRHNKKYVSSDNCMIVYRYKNNKDKDEFVIGSTVAGNRVDFYISTNVSIANNAYNPTIRFYEIFRDMLSAYINYDLKQLRF